MAEDKNSKVTQNQDRINKLIDGLTLFDDDLMSRVFDKNIEATELLLRIILERKIKVISVIGQEEMKSAAVGGRNITLDVHALDENGEKMDIEVQGNSEGAHIRRARYHSSVLDSRMLKEGQVFYAYYAKPEGFCDEAWKAIYQYAFALSHGAEKELFYYGDWIRKPGVAICSCNDGLRPVIFKLEATEQTSEINYTPVR